MQFNLLPDVKLQYLRAVRLKRLTMSISFIASAAAVMILIILLVTVYVWQKKTMSDLDGDITTYSQKVESTPNLNQTLTVQSQLKSLPGLHDQKPVATRLFDYVKKVTPSKDGITDLQIDFTMNTLSIQGKAPNLDSVNTFVDTLKYTNYEANGAKKVPAFSQVVLSEFNTTSKETTFTITMTYDPNIFSSQQQVKLDVPNIVTTHSDLNSTTDLFQKAPKKDAGGTN